MSSTLVISDNDLLNQLYSINLEVYLATNVKLVTSIQEAQSLIENGNTFDLILTMNLINGQDSAETIFEFLKIKNLTIPLIVIGNYSGKIESAIFVQSSYNLENLLRSSALFRKFPLLFTPGFTLNINITIRPISALGGPILT